MSEQIEPGSLNWYKTPEMTVGDVISKGVDKYITAEDAAYFPDNVSDAVALLAFYIEKAGDDPEVVLKEMGLFEVRYRKE